MLYPNLPDYSELRPEELQRFYRELLVYTDELKFLLETRDNELDTRPSNGNVVFSASAGKFRGFVSGTGWVDFN